MAGKGRPFISKLSVPGKGSDELSYVFFDSIQGQHKEEIVLFGLFSITSSSEIYRVFIKQTVKHFLDFYHRTPTSLQQSFDRDGVQSAEFLFENALQYTHERVTEQLTAADEEGNPPPVLDVKKIHFLLGAIVGDALYLCSGGTFVNALYIYPIFKKEGFSHYKVLDILTDGKSAPEGLARLYSNYMSGKVSIPGSILVLCNRALMDYHTPEQLKSTVTNVPAHQLPAYFENIFTKTHSRFDFSALFIHPHYAGSTDHNDRQLQAAPNRSMEGLNSTARGTNTILSPSAVTPLKQTVKTVSDIAVRIARKINPLMQKWAEMLFILSRRGMKRIATVRWDQVIPQTADRLRKLGPLLSRVSTSTKGLLDGERRKQMLESFFVGVGIRFRTFMQNIKHKLRNLPIASKVLLLLSILFIGLFAQSIVSLQAKKALARNQAAAQELVRAAELKCDLAEASILYADDARARMITAEAQNIIAMIPVRNDTTSERERLQGRIQLILNKVDRVMDIASPQLLSVLTDNIPTPEQVRIVGAQSNTAILSTADTLYQVNLTSGDINAIDTQAKLPLIGCGTMANAHTIYICSGEGLKLSEVNLKENTVKPVSLSAGKNEQRMTDIAVYNKRLYVLDANRVYRHMPSDGGFAQGTVVSEGKATADSRGLAIDGGVYMLSGERNVIQFARSAQNTIALPTLTPPIGTISRMVTSEDLPMLYLLDAEHARIIILDKESHTLKGQIRSAVLSQPRDFMVIPGKNSQKIIVLDGPNIYIMKVPQ